MKDKDNKEVSVPDPTTGPFRFTISSIKKAISGIGALFKNPKILILTLFISGLQTGLAYLKIYLPTNELVKYASLITFAQGGMYAGLLGAIGGVLGKGFYAWFINTLVFSAFKKKEPKKVKQKTPKTKGAIVLALFGVGLALITYNFLSGNASLENSAIGIIAMAASFRTLKKKDGFLVGFICSFTKGRMTTNAAAAVIKGMIVGFLFGVLSSLKFSGIWCYMVGVVFLVLGLVFLLPRKRVLAATAALIVLMGSLLPVFAMAQITDKWVTPQEAYGIKGDTLTSYMELVNAMDASPPANMELTLVAIGMTYFDKSVAIEQQTVLVENGTSGSFKVEAQFDVASFNSLVSLHLEEDGYYASSSTSYSANQQWTNYETEEGTYQTDEKSYFTFRHMGAASYLYADYVEAGKVYIEISIPFAYGDVMGEGKVDSATSILARVDSVKRDPGESAYEPASGYWELKDTLTYMLLRGDNFISTTNKFTNQWSGNDPVDSMNISVSGTEINIVRTTKIQDTERIFDVTASFGVPPSQLKAFDTLNLSFSEAGTYYDGLTNSTIEYGNGMAVAGYFSGNRGDSFNTKIDSNDVMVYAFGADLGQVWLERSNGQLVTSIPAGTTSGEIMTLELAMGNNKPYNSNEGYSWAIPVIAYIYEWKGGTLPPTDDEEEEEWIGWGEVDEWDEHASEEETGAISALAAIAGLAGAAAAAAGLGGFGSSNSGYIKRNKDGDLVVNDPVTGEQRIYVVNANTGRYTNPLTGAEYTEDELQSSVASRAENESVLRQDYEQSERAKAEQREENQKLSRAENDMRVENKMRSIQRDLEQKGKAGDEIAAAMAVTLNRINTQKRETGSFNTKDFEQFKKTHSKWTNGTIAGNSGLPKAESEWDIFKQGLANTGEEIARGESNKAIALRVAVSMLVGSFAARQAISAAGAAVIEAGMEFVQATVVMKDYVDKGGNDWKEGAQQAIVKTLQGEAMGRAFGYGLGALGKAASKTGQIMSKVKAGKIIVDSVSNLGTKAGDLLTTNVGDVPNALRKMCTEASESAVGTKIANAGMNKFKNSFTKSSDNTGKSIGDLPKKVTSASKDSIQKTGRNVDASNIEGTKPQSDSLKKTGTDADTLGKKAESSADAKTAKRETIVPKDTPEYKKVSKEVDDSINKAQASAADKIEKYKNNVSKDPELAARKAAHEEGGRIGQEKVNKLEQARKDLANNPDSPELKKEFEKSVQDVQKNKHAQKVMNEKEFVSNATREEFNKLKVEKDAVIAMNSSERIAAEFGLDPKNVSNVQATNSMDTGGVGNIKGVASKSDLGTSDGRIPRKFNEGDLDASRLEQKGGERISIDTDQTYRMKITMKDGTVVYKDLPANKIRQLQNEEVYKAWNNGELPLKPDGSVDYEKVKNFANDMDYTVVDARSADAYGTVGDLQQALKNDGSIRQYGDPEAVSKTIKYKSDEWFEKADLKTSNANYIDAEGDVAEGIRQATKQFDSQLVYQVKAINTKAGITRVTIPDKLSEGMSVLKQIGHGKGKLSPAEAEAVLKEMGTNTDEILKLNSEETEFINRLIAGRYKDE